MKYDSLFEQATDAIMVTDFKGNFKDVNSNCCTLFGYAKQELLQLKITALLAPSRLKENPIRFDILATGRTIFNEREMVDKKGTIIYVKTNAKKFDGNSILVIARDITQRKFLEKELLHQKMQEHKKIIKAVTNAQENERAEIGRELHDNVNQLLATSKLYQHQSLKVPYKRLEYITKSQEYLSCAIEELRKLSQALVGPTQDKTMGLIASLDKLLNDISILEDIEISSNYSTCREEEIEVGLKLVIYRIVQEQLNNILKHAQASKIEVEIKKEANRLQVSITDNGKGFCLSEKRNGIGLKNIKNRAEIYNGIVEIISAPGAGCKMKIIFME
ncbi:MAG: PAS domain-containing sensor histidine kinase [Ginsengibacter sp.]